MVGEQLYGNGVDDRGEQTRVAGEADYMHSGAGGEVAVEVGEDIQLAAAGVDFLHVGGEFFQEAVIGGDDHHRHVLVHQGQGAVFQLAGRIGLGVNVGNLLEFEGALQGDGIVEPPSQEEGMLLLREAPRPDLDLRFQIQGMLDTAGELAQGVQMGGLGFRR